MCTISQTVHFPKMLLSLLVANQAIQLIIGVPHRKWLPTDDHKKEDDCSGKEIDLLALILQIVQKLRCHEGRSAQNGLKVVVAAVLVQRRCKSEINYLELEIVAQHCVLRFQITMREVAFMAMPEAIQ